MCKNHLGYPKSDLVPCIVKPKLKLNNVLNLVLHGPCEALPLDPLAFTPLPIDFGDKWLWVNTY